jgi:hypothetical protein
MLEFNELSPMLIDRFVSQGMLPNFRRLRDQSHCYITDADGRYPNLEPWIQWTTVHTGMPYQEHGVITLDEGHKLKRKCIWDLLSDAGHRVWICGAMNARYGPNLNGAVLPDCWASQVHPRPAGLEPFYRFIKKNVQEHTNSNARFTRSDYLAFIGFLIRNGLSLSTLKSIAQQLLAERVGLGRWRRAPLLDKLQFDVFKSYYRKLRPQFSIFFSNSTAHFQHIYWRNMDPSSFQVKPTPEEQLRFEDAVLFGYQQMDQLIENFVELAGDKTTLILATGLSQQPCLTYEHEGGKVIYRPRDFASFLTFLSIGNYTEVVPVMAEQFYVRFANEAHAQVASEILESIKLEGRAVFCVGRQGADLFCGCQIHSEVKRDAILHIGTSDCATPFYKLLYRIEGVKSGMHHPDGVLWIRYPSRSHYLNKEKVPLVNLAPTVLDLFAVPFPEYMHGESLLRRDRSTELLRHSESQIEMIS